MNPLQKKQLIIKFVLLFVLLHLIVPFDANAGDNWFGKDKIRHFGVSGFYTLFSYKVVKHHFGFSDGNSAKFAIGVTLSLGLFKEAYDSQHPEETSSFKDIIVDIFGIAAGLYIATR